MALSPYRGILLSPLLLLLTACGGNDNQPDNIINQAAIITNTDIKIKGIAIDGYLGLAQACLDFNNNFQCDGSSEYKTLTNDRGEFSFTVPQSLSVNAPVLIIANAGLTIDSDYPNKVIKQSFFLLANYHKDQSIVVSPFSTLLYQKSLSKSLTAAENELLTLLKLSDRQQLYNDFVAATSKVNTTSAQQKTNQRIRLLARVIVAVMAQARAASHDNATAFIMGASTVDKLLLEKFSGSVLTTITTQVDTAIAQGNNNIAVISAAISNLLPQIVISSDEIEVVLPQPTKPDVTPTPAEKNTPAAPTNLIVDDQKDQLNWTDVIGYSLASDYEYSVDNQPFNLVQTKPLVIGNINLAVGKLRLRIKANLTDGHLAGISASNNQSFNQITSQLPAVLLNNANALDNINQVLHDYQLQIAALNNGNHPGDILRDTAKTASAYWHQFPQLITLATPLKQTLINALTTTVDPKDKVTINAVITRLTVQISTLTALADVMPLSIINGFNHATSLTPVSQLAATINNSRFAKIDWAGNLIEKITTREQGWRCVLDTSSKARTVWALLSGDNQQDWVNFSLANGDSTGDVKAQYRNQEICGNDHWQLPNQEQLTTLTSAGPAVSGIVKLAQDRSLLPDNATQYSCLLDVANKRAWIPFDAVGTPMRKELIVDKLASLNNASKPRCGLTNWQLSGKEAWAPVDENSAIFKGIDRNKEYFTENYSYQPYSVYYNTGMGSKGWIEYGFAYPGEELYVRAAAILSDNQMPQGGNNIDNKLVFPLHRAAPYWLAPQVDNLGNATGLVHGLRFNKGSNLVTVSQLNNDNATSALARYINVSQPLAPTITAGDDTKNTLTFTPSGGFIDPTDYKISLDGGINWQTVNNFTINLGNENISANDILIYIEQTPLYPASYLAQAQAAGIADFTKSN